MTTASSVLWTAKDIIAATHAKVLGAPTWLAGGISIDSRTLKEGDVFVAIKGEKMDGHDYVKAALDKGASAVLVSHVPIGVMADDRVLMVEHTIKALEQLGMAARARTRAQIVGVTGSVGKTGCKEMLKMALSACGKTYATSGNLNNHYGVPLSLANMPADCDYAVMEMGMNHAGEISMLSHWVRPHVSVITTVEAVHLEFFDSVAGIADAKAEMFDGMGEAGVAILNADNAHFKRLQKHAETKGLDRVLSFGTRDSATCQMRQYSTEGLESVVEAVIAGTPLRYRLGAIGKHWGLMSVAVLAAVEALGADLAKAAQALAQFSEPAGRGKIEMLKVAGGHLRLIDDAYNASPVSMAAAFEKMALVAGSITPRPRTLAILGDMLELGTDSADLHVGLAPTLVNSQIDLVFAAGQFMKHLYDALPEDLRGDYDATASGLAPKVVKRLQANDLVLVKGSNGSRMREVVTAIRDNAKHAEER